MAESHRYEALCEVQPDPKSLGRAHGRMCAGGAGPKPAWCLDLNLCVPVEKWDGVGEVNCVVDEPVDLPGLDARVLERAKEMMAHSREALVGLKKDLGPTDGHPLTHLATRELDALVAFLARSVQSALAETDAAPQHLDAVARIGIVALGSYGRFEFCPCSDVDLLFLLPRTPPKSVGRSPYEAHFVRTVLYGLWDLGLEVGHAVRTEAECFDVAAQDHSALTALLDARLVRWLDQDRHDAALVCDPRAGLRRPGASRIPSGFDRLLEVLDQKLLVGAAARRLIEAKVTEAQERRARYGDSVYLLEPNVKESLGGLRELHTARWVARARWHVRDLEGLLQHGLLWPQDKRAIERAYGFLLRVRCELHLLSGRRQDILGFEYQEPIARNLGYLSSDETQRSACEHGVERLMRAYYFHARQLRVRGEAVVERAMAGPDREKKEKHSGLEGFSLCGGALRARGKTQFQQDPSAMIRIFRVAQEEGVRIEADTKKWIAESLALVDRQVRRSKPAVSDFLALLQDPQADGTVVEAMHELGAFRRMIPEFLRITARWQYSLYHVYTVDVHSLVVFKNLKRLQLGDFQKEQPELTQTMRGLPRPLVLYMAGLLHDVGKGWPRDDHSVRGGLVARAVGERFEVAGLPVWGPVETQDLVWLVENHLLLSDTAQRRDISDEDLLLGLWAELGSEQRLSMLHVLTFADMRGTSPKVWTDWKGALLRELSERLKVVLSRRDEAPLKSAESHLRLLTKQAFESVEQIKSGTSSNVSTATVAAFTAAMPARYLCRFSPQTMLAHVKMWHTMVEHGGIAIEMQPMEPKGTIQVTILCEDRPGLLSVFAGVMAAYQLDVLSAQAYTAKPDASLVLSQGDGASLALDVLHVQDVSGTGTTAESRWGEIGTRLKRAVLGEMDLEALLDARVRPKKGHVSIKRLEVRTELAFFNEDSRDETVIDVFCQNHLGVLYTIAKALTDQALSIRLAKISTQGDRVADGFYVSDAVSRQKILDPKRLELIRTAVEQAIARATGGSFGRNAREPRS